jgi:SAM-dependent methyltransferase
MVSERELARQREYQRIVDTFHKDHDYRKMYRDYAIVSKDFWEDKDRKDYQADLWYNLNCNDICLEILGDVCKDKTVLSVGGGIWLEKIFLDSITARQIIRTDLIEDDGILPADAADLPFEDNLFDVVICRELIEHVPDEQKVFSEIKRVLVPDGYLLLTTPNAFSIAIDGTFHVRGYTPLSLLAELRQQGFEVIRKRGNMPYAFHGLKIFSQAGITQALDEFKKLDKLTRHDELRYYMGTSLFVLAQKTLVKEHYENIISAA